MIGNRPRIVLALLACVAIVAAGCTSHAITPLPTTLPTGSASVPAPPTSASSGARPEHIVVVIFENKGAEQIIGGGRAPAFDALARQGVLYTRSYAITHPSQPNYLALFSGSTQGVTNDSCPHTFSSPNLGRQLLDAGMTFAAYSEGLPHSGFSGCGHGDYARKHAPWTNFSDLPPSVGQPYASMPTDFSKLPTVAFVIPDLCDDMHNCSIGTGDRWLKAHIDAYATWAQTHHSLLIVTFDEDDSSGANIIPTIVVGQNVNPARVNDRIDHYTVLRTIESCLGLGALGVAAVRTPLPQMCR